MKMKLIMENWKLFTEAEEPEPERSPDYPETDEKIQEARIRVGYYIDQKLQRPSNDEEINKAIRAPNSTVDKFSYNLLLYLYQGKNPEAMQKKEELEDLLDNGQITSEQYQTQLSEINENTEAVGDEIWNRAMDFADWLTPFEQSVFLLDYDLIVNEYIPHQREINKELEYPDHQSTFMLKRAPGTFRGFQFGRFVGKNLAVFRDTTAGSGVKDYMYKATDELKNINPAHHYIFKLEFTLQTAKEVIRTQQDYDKSLLNSKNTFPPLSFHSYLANYTYGYTEKRLEEEDNSELDPNDGRVGELMAMETHRRNELFRYFYFGDYLKDTKEEMIKMIDYHMPKLIDIDGTQARFRQDLLYLPLIALFWDKFPQESKDKYSVDVATILNTADKSPLMKVDVKELIKKPRTLDRSPTRGPAMFPDEKEAELIELANKRLDRLIELAKTNPATIFTRVPHPRDNDPDATPWSQFLDYVYNHLNKDSKNLLEPRLNQLKDILQSSSKGGG